MDAGMEGIIRNSEVTGGVVQRHRVCWQQPSAPGTKDKTTN